MRADAVREPMRYQLWIVAAAGVIFLTNLGGAALWDLDEALYSTTAREMFDRGNWIVPMFNGQMSAIKPPLAFWAMIGGYELFGPNEFEWGARQPDWRPFILAGSCSTPELDFGRA